MTVRKIIYFGIALILASFIVIFGYQKYGNLGGVANEPMADNSGVSTSTSGVSTSTFVLRANPNLSIKDNAWNVLQKYLEFAKNHNILGVKNLSYQLSESCKNPSKGSAAEKDCFMRMDTVYYFGTQFKKNEFKNIWSDEKQIILTSDLVREENKDAIFLSRGIIYFVIDGAGNIKLLKFNDSEGVSMPKEGRTVEEIDNYLQKRMLDEDKDGIEDEIERCEGQPESCVKTDSKNRDTDGDGFWDGVETQFYSAKK
jgi:hypothetical protein